MSEHNPGEGPPKSPGNGEKPAPAKAASGPKPAPTPQRPLPAPAAARAASGPKPALTPQQPLSAPAAARAASGLKPALTPQQPLPAQPSRPAPRPSGLTPQQPLPAQPSRPAPRPSGLTPQQPLPAQPAAGARLHAALFEDQPPTAQAASPASGPTAAQPGQAAAPQWPRSVPSRAVALQAIRGELERPELVEPTRKFLAALSRAETDALWDDSGAAPHLHALRQGVLTRWRLETALSLKPEPGAAVDVAAMEELLAEVDGVLGQLAAPEDADGDLKAGFASARGALARQAVTLSEYARAVGEAAAKVAAAAAQTKYKHVARMVSMGARQPSARKPRLVYVLFGVVLLGTGGFHLWRYQLERTSPPPPPPVAGVPTGMTGGTDPRTGVTVIRGKPGSAELEKMYKQAEAAGKVLRQIGPDLWISFPQGMPMPNLPPPPPPPSP